MRAGSAPSLASVLSNSASAVSAARKRVWRQPEREDEEEGKPEQHASERARATPFFLAALTADAELLKTLARLGADPGGRHQWRRVLCIYESGIGAEPGERLEQLGIGSKRGQKKWRGAELVQTRVVQVCLPLHPRVQVGATRSEFLDELDAAQAPLLLERQLSS